MRPLLSYAGENPEPADQPMVKMLYQSHSARMSCCQRYRYSLRRRFFDGNGRVLFIGLNPSAADGEQDDPTIRRCASFARDWGYRSFEVVNLFAWRSAHPDALKCCVDPIGPDNELWLLNGLRRADQVIACWGNHGRYRGRAAAVRALCGDLSILKLNLGGEPTHPLYLPAGLKPRIWPHKKGLALRIQS
ncbi:MAG: DUF1643 domain-containing protein [Gammaproteobacteria bacterium]